ncbi:PREDICTED: protein PHYTOCHROME KINASE SUBSTRATE 4 isoform X1 [Ipomoea nil]|uniref:protein PHYTOCHROME KINASE SUBSTRATE 4 isoform X1 n=1 Tax=Ipomoea nil TaxID=35883 RepID=UPI0009014203|nr:PREDICTED: protein PHYTOCHROME KINASE SUBSTRATE 4 isoform X1 [Ipomoea nil]
MNSLHYTCSKKSNDQLRLRDVSFSSYLKQAGEDESEINVFDAKKYFSESTDWKELGNRSLFPAIRNQNGSCDLSEINRFSSVSSVDAAGFGRNVKASSFHATPTASSEASWNSQTGLLSNPPGAIAVSLKNNNVSEGDLEKRRGSAAAKWFFCRSKCPCSGKKSVQVDEAIRNGHNDQQKIVLEERNQNLGLKVEVSPPETGHGVLLSPGLRRGESQSPLASTGGFSFPILNPSSQAAAAVAKMTIRTSDIEDQIQPPKNSLEIFQPPTSRKSLDAEIQLSPKPRGGGVVDNRDRRAGNFGFPGSPISRDDDVGSDASSDLFEIESFSTQTTSYRRRDSLDDEGTFVSARRLAPSNPYGGRRSLDEPATPSVAATENYAPSEVSIDWSVTTAEGVTNFSMEDHGGGGSRHWSWEYGREGKGSKGNGLLSCRHEKAVSVGPQPQPVKVAVAAAPDLIGPQTEPPPGALILTASHVSGTGRPPKPNKPPLATSHSARLSLAFAA